MLMLRWERLTSSQFMRSDLTMSVRRFIVERQHGIGTAPRPAPYQYALHNG